MGIEGNLPYAAARVHARHGLRLNESAWRRIEASRDLGQYLDAVRGGALAPWVAGLDAASETHAIERLLRGAWRAYVRAVASWHPQAWQAWLEWWAWLPLLPLIARLAVPKPVPGWMLVDPVCGPVAPGSPAERAAALESTPLGPLAPALRTAAAIGTAWMHEAAARVPQANRQTREQLSLLIRLLAPASEAIPARHAPSLLRLFRATAGSVVASGCHLTLTLIDLERLRGGLVLRSLFDSSAAEVA
jgi:hypothetical protein